MGLKWKLIGSAKNRKIVTAGDNSERCFKLGILLNVVVEDGWLVVVDDEELLGVEEMLVEVLGVELNIWLRLILLTKR